MNAKIIPMGALVLLMTGSGALVATAQNLSGTPAVEAQGAGIVPAHFREGRGGRGGRDAGLGGRGLAGMFAEIDRDGDGSITQADVDAYLDARHAGADADGNGAVSLEEFQAFWVVQTRQPMTRAFQRLDADASGGITAEEIDARFGGVVARMDRDGDGALSREDRRGREGRGRN